MTPDEAVAIAELFGVAAEQVRRDHLLSHLLSALAVGAGDQVVFFGGTALARTHLPDGKVSARKARHSPQSEKTSRLAPVGTGSRPAGGPTAPEQ